MWLSATFVIFVAGLLLIQFEIGQREEKEAAITDHIAMEMGELQSHAFEYVLQGNEKLKRKLLEKYENIGPLLRSDLFLYTDEQSAMDRIREKHEELGPILHRAITRGNEQSGEDGPGDPRDEKETRLFGLFQVKSQEMHNDAVSLGTSIRREMTESDERVRLLIIVLSAVMASALIVASFLLERLIVIPLARLQEGVEIIGTGNLLHKVGTDVADEIGLLSKAFDRMTDNLRGITASRDELDREMEERLRVEGELRKTADDLAVSNEALKKSLAEVRTLRGILPICSGCKKIRDDKGYWEHLESYITSNTGALLSHGICPECMKKMYPGYAE